MLNSDREEPSSQQKTKAANNIAEVERERAEQERSAKQELKQVLYAAQLQLADAHITGGQPATASNLLDLQLPETDEPDPRGFEWHFLKRRCNLPEILEKEPWTEKLTQREIARAEFTRDRAGEDTHTDYKFITRQWAAAR